MKKYLFAIIIVLFLPALITLPIFNDGGAYAYMGSLFFEGMLPYQDGWDHKGISLYFINGLGYLLGFKSYYGIRLVEFILLIVSMSMIYTALKEKYSEKIALLASIFGLFTLLYFFDGGNLTEEYTSYFVLICVALLLKHKIRPIHYMVIGFLFLIALTIRANLIGFWISLFFYLVAQLFQKKTKEVLLQFGYMFIGFLVAVIFLGIYFISTDSFQAFYEAAFSYNFSYSKNSPSGIILSMIEVMRKYEVSIIIIAGLLVSLLQIKNKRSGLLEGLLITWIPVEMYFSNMSGKQFAHYYLTWVPLIILSMAVLANYFRQELQGKEKRFVVITVLFFLCFQIPSFKLLNKYKGLVTGVVHKKEKKAIANHIQQNYDSDQVLVWGNGIYLYPLLEKRAPVPYFYQTFLKVENEYSSKYSADLLSQFQSNLPALVVDARTNSMIFLDESNGDEVSKSMKKYTQEFLTFFKDRYEWKERKFDMNFYVLKKNE